MITTEKITRRDGEFKYVTITRTRGPVARFFGLEDYRMSFMKREGIWYDERDRRVSEASALQLEVFWACHHGQAQAITEETEERVRMLTELVWTAARLPNPAIDLLICTAGTFADGLHEIDHAA